jgi:prepilin-type processing-associated H-X9-DG protein
MGIVFKMYNNEAKGAFPTIQIGSFPAVDRDTGVIGGYKGSIDVGPNVFAMYPEYLTDPAIVFCPSKAGLAEAMANAKFAGGPQAGQWCFGYAVQNGGMCGRAIDNSYGYLGYVMDNARDTALITSMGFFSVLQMLGVDTSTVKPDSAGPVQFGGVLTRLVDVAALGPYVSGLAQGTYGRADEDVNMLDLSTPLPGMGNGGGNTVYRLREGIERFLITDINNAGSANVAQSSVWIMFDQLSTAPAAYNHIPGGANVLYMDGHVEFKKYDRNGEAPANEAMATFVGVLTMEQ